jgi:hypothetical protein
VKKPVSKFAFQMQPAALQRGEREVAARHVAGLYKLNAIDLALSREEEVGLHESAWFQPLNSATWLNAIAPALSREEEVGLHESAWHQPLNFAMWYAGLNILAGKWV